MTYNNILGYMIKIRFRIKCGLIFINCDVKVLLVMGGESNGRLLRNTECFAVGYSSWRCSIPEVARRPNPHYHQLQVLPPMQHARAYCAVATQQNMVYVLGG